MKAVKIKNIIIICILLIIILFSIIMNKNILSQKKENIKYNGISVYVDSNKQENIPTKDSGYDFDRAMCSDSEAIIDWDSNTWSYSLSNISDAVSCTLYFKAKPADYLVDFASVSQFIDYTPPAGKSSENKTCYADVPNEYSGWRVLSKTGTGITGTVALVHAGTPDCYYHAHGHSTQSIIDINNLGSNYVNTIFARTGRSLDCNDIKTYNSNACANINNFATITNNMVKTNSYYWLASVGGSNDLWNLREEGLISYSYDHSLGYRPVIVLKSGIKKTGGLGTNESPFTISI